MTSRTTQAQATGSLSSRFVQMFGATAQDVRHALRLIRREPAFTFTALATLALGIGLNTAIFSVAYGVLWRPLPYPNPDRLIIVSSAQQTETGVKTFSTWPPVTYEGLRPRVTTLDHLAAYISIDVQLTGRGEPLQLPALGVSPNFFATLGVNPARGRAFLTGAAAPDDDRAAIVSDRLWRTSLQADPAIVGQSITVDGVPRTVVGVLPPDFTFRPVIPRLGALPDADIVLPNRWPGDHRRERVSLPAGPHEARRDAGTRGSGIDRAGERSVDRTDRRTHDGRRIRVERPHARARGQLAGARHGVGASAAADPARGGLVRAPDRLRQRREPADGAPHRAPRRTVRPHGPRRRTPADRASAADGSGRVVAAGRVARRDARVARDRRHPAARAASRAAAPRRHRDRRPRHDVLPRLVAGLDAADRARAGAAHERGHVWRRPRAACRRNAHDRRPSGRAAADAAGRRTDRDDARPADRRGPADPQLRASHVGVDGLRIERPRRRRPDREGDAARTLRRRARTHPCVRARRARSHPVPARRDVREPDQLDAVRQDVHPGRLRHRGAAEADALCRRAEDRAGLFQDHGNSAAGGTRVHAPGHGGRDESGDRQRAHRARILSRWSEPRRSAGACA